MINTFLDIDPTYFSKYGYANENCCVFTQQEIFSITADGCVFC